MALKGGECSVSFKCFPWWLSGGAFARCKLLQRGRVFLLGIFGSNVEQTPNPGNRRCVFTAAVQSPLNLPCASGSLSWPCSGDLHLKTLCGFPSASLAFKQDGSGSLLWQPLKLEWACFHLLGRSPNAQRLWNFLELQRDKLGDGEVSASSFYLPTSPVLFAFLGCKLE